MNADSSLVATAERKDFFSQMAQRSTEALRVLSATPRTLGLIWAANPFLAVTHVVINLALGLTPLAEIWITKLMIDAITLYLRSASAGKNLPFSVFSLLGLLVLVRLISNAVEPTRTYVGQQLGEFLTCNINTSILKKANSLVDISFFETPKFHDLLHRAQNEAAYRPISILSCLTTILRSGVSLSSMVIVLVAFQPMLALFVIALSLPHLFFQFKHHREFFAIQDSEVPEVRRMHYFSHILTSKYDAKEIRLFGLGEFFLNQYRMQFSEFQKRHSKMRLAHWRSNVLLATLSAAGTAGAYAFVAFNAIKNTISIGTLTLYLSAITQIEYGMEAIIWSMSQLYEGSLFINNLFEFLDMPLPMSTLPADCARQAPERLCDGIRFEHVAFTYPGSDRKVLQDVSFMLEPGQTVALVGDNGAGKTTLVKLLSRLYDPSEGKILVDGLDLREYSLDSWRSKIGVIFQDFCRYHMTARENIGVGRVGSIEDLEAVKRAAERGNAQCVVDKLANGYDTTLGLYYSTVDRGAELSGGEWQKIALARAFMRSLSSQEDQEQVSNAAAIRFPNECSENFSIGSGGGGFTAGVNETDGREQESGIKGGDQEPFVLAAAGPEAPSRWADDAQAQLLILDEPTAALDAKAEYDVYMRFHDLTRGKTTLLISHRFSTVRMADLILVLDDGRIIEQGSHKQLMDKGGEYARLYNLQADRYK